MKKIILLSKTRCIRHFPSELHRIESGVRKVEPVVKTLRFSFSLPFNEPYKSREWLMSETGYPKPNQNGPKGSFQEAISSTLLLGQIFAIMPVIGIRGKSASDLKFSWTAIRTIYGVIVFIMATGYASLSVYTSSNAKVEFDLVVPIIFYLSVVFAMLCFLLLAKKWPVLMKRWETIENDLPPMRTQKRRRLLWRKVQLITFSVSLLSLTEHIFNVVSIITSTNRCGKQSNSNDLLRDFFYTQLSQLFQVTDYALWKAIVGKYLNIICTYMWTYMDIFVMVISVSLADRFSILNEDLKRIRGHNMTEQFWAIKRIQYRKMCGLVSFIDETVSHITIVSFTNNLFFVCVQLLRTLRPMASLSHAVYFWFSMVFLIGRTMAVSMFAAQVHDESKKPIEILCRVPTESWCLEISRFSDEVNNGLVALSGMRFFYLTRRLILSVAGTIATYELVLFQFNADKEAPKGC